MVGKVGKGLIVGWFDGWRGFDGWMVGKVGGLDGLMVGNVGWSHHKHLRFYSKTRCVGYKNKFHFTDRHKCYGFHF